MDINPKQYEEVADRVAKIVANLKIHNFNGHVIIDTTGRVPTACWSKNPETGNFTISLGYELLLKLNAEETLGIIEHELLHHVQYRNCDIRNQLMSNIVLDVAINKILYLCNSNVTESWANKVYNDEETDEKWTYKIEGTDELGNFLEDPVILACPHLDANDIQQIPNPEIQAAYIDIWGSRKTTADFNVNVPVPLSLYYKLVKFIDKDKPQDGRFGEDSEDGSDGGDQGSRQSNSKNNDSGNKKKSKRRCNDKEGVANSEDDATNQEDTADKKQDKSGGGDKNNTEEKDKGKDKQNDANNKTEASNKNNTEEKDEGKDKQNDANNKTEASNKNNDDNSDDDSDNESKQSSNGYNELEPDPLDNYFQEKNNKAEQAGKRQAKIKFTFAPPTEINSWQVEERIKERIFEQTVDEIGDTIAGTLQDNIARQPYITRPTRTTLTHMACGVTDYLPIYYNDIPGQGQPKVACYIDVSGSMTQHMRLVHSIMCRISEFMPSMSFVFSGSVMPLPTLAWNKVIPVGGGTSFNNVFKHICLSNEVKQNWIEKWIEQNPVIEQNYAYKYDSSLKQCIAEYIKEIGVQADFLSEDFPVVFIITDGKDDISNSLIKKFKQTGKRLVVLLLTEYVQKQHAFQSIDDATIIQINGNAEIIDRGTD